MEDNMRAWGVKLYPDYVASDVKEEYVIKLRAGFSKDEITERAQRNTCSSNSGLVRKC